MLRTIALLAWFPFIWQPVWGQSPTSRVNKSTIKQPNGGARGNQAGDADQRGTKNLPLVIDTEGHHQTDDERAKADAKKKHILDVESNTIFYAKLAAWCTFALVIVGGGGVGSAIYTLRSINQQVELQERAIRPWIGTDFIPPGTVLEISGRLEVTANISLKNTGPSVALDGIMLPHLISSRTAALPNDIKDAWIRTETQLRARNSTEWETGFVLHPTRSHTHESVMGGSMPYSDMEARLCYVLVCVIYRDQFGKEHRTQDCFSIRTQGPDVPPNGIAFTAVPAHQKAT